MSKYQNVAADQGALPSTTAKIPKTAARDAGPDPLEREKPGEAVGRSAWLVSATPHQPGRVPHDLAFDQESGVLLYMKSSGDYLGFEELFLDEELDDETFRWDGPVEQRKIGSALVIPEEDGTYSIIWEVSVRDRPIYHQDGPPGITKDEAVRWGEERAAQTLVREH